ncbi:MAG: AMP-binding protein [Clostridiales Family XIII bacterium]|jgi:long-subunit acyl-CoA synthetase (AMP-forming)|nr:AMP-binding protein [Clostridiales Family XIII bacterium]
MISTEDYRRIKEKELQVAEARVDGIRNSADPHVRYRDVRPITDVRHMLETSVELYADRVAFHVKDSHDAPYRGISYRKAKEDVDALGTFLAGKGLRGGKIAVIGENCYQWAISYLAAVCGVGVVVPLDKELSAKEIEDLLIESGTECALFTEKFRDMFIGIRNGGRTALKFLVDLTGGGAGQDALSLEDCLGEGARMLSLGERGYLDAQILEDDLCALLFTSGTTGIAKGVMLSHKNLAAGITIPPTVLNIVKEDVFFSILPVHHCYECTCGFLIPLYRGASVAYCEGLKYIVKNLSEARPTVVLLVPLILESLYGKIWQNAKKNGKDGLLRRVSRINSFTKRIGIDLAPIFFKQIQALFGGRMKVVICGGAAIDPAVLQGIKDFGIMAVQGYGLTECSPICALNPDSASKNDAAGYLVPGFDGMIADPDPETGIGEICAKGDHVMMGYCNDPEATAEVLRDGWFYTGDLGYIDSDRYVHITGRKKNVIITKNGKNVFPEELEYHLGRLDVVAESMVWGKDSEATGETLIVASIRPDGDALREALGEGYADEDVERLLWEKIDAINDELALFKRIRRIVVRKEEFEMTTGKKIKRFVDANKGETD